MVVSLDCSSCGMATSGPWFGEFVGRIKLVDSLTVGPGVLIPVWPATAEGATGISKLDSVCVSREGLEFCR